DRHPIRQGTAETRWPSILAAGVILLPRGALVGFRKRRWLGEVLGPENRDLPCPLPGSRGTSTAQRHGHRFLAGRRAGDYRPLGRADSLVGNHFAPATRRTDRTPRRGDLVGIRPRRMPIRFLRRGHDRADLGRIHRPPGVAGFFLPSTL